MISENLLAFIGIASVLTVTPGLDTAVVLRTAALEGPRHGMSAALGIGAGCLCWGAAVAVGLGALLLTSPAAFGTLKVAGAVYLIWLGANLLLRPRRSISEDAVAGNLPGSSIWVSIGRGFTTNILNPKVGLFYITLLPQYVPTAASTASYSLLLACAHVVLAVAWFIVLAAMADAVRRYLDRPGMLRLIDRVTGGVFVGFGLHLTLI